MPRLDVYSSALSETLVPSAARTTSGDTEAIPGWGGTGTLRAQLNVSAVSGTTPTLDVVIEDTLDGTNWNTIGTFAQKTATGREVINITTPFTDKLRARWTTTGDLPSFTFAVDVYSAGK